LQYHTQSGKQCWGHERRVFSSQADKFYQTGTKASHQSLLAKLIQHSPDAPLEIAIGNILENISKKADSVNPIGQSSNIVPLLTFALLFG